MKTKNKQTLQVFKVIRIVGDEYLSLFDHNCARASLVLKYAPGRITKPKIARTRIWAFTDMADAKNFVAHSKPHLPPAFAIFRGLATEVRSARFARVFGHRSEATLHAIQLRNRQALKFKSEAYPSCVQCSSLQITDRID